MANKKHYYYNKNKKSAKQANSNAEAVSAELSLYTATQLAMTLAELNVSESTQELLKKYHIEKASDLIKRTEKDMYKVQGLNKKILFELKDRLREQGMAFRIEQPAEKKDAQKSDKQKGKGTQREVNKSTEQTQSKKSEKKSSQDGGQNQAQQRSKFGIAERKETQQKPKQVVQKLTEPLQPGEWRKVLKGGKWGYSNGFKVVIPTMYDEIFAFKEGLAAVELDEKCGYVNEQNEIVIPLDYDMAMSFSEGYACVMRGVKMGYINKNNEVVIPFEYDAATAFENGEAKIKKDGKWGTIKPDGSIIWI